MSSCLIDHHFFEACLSTDSIDIDSGTFKSDFHQRLYCLVEWIFQ